MITSFLISSNTRLHSCSVINHTNRTGMLSCPQFSNTCTHSYSHLSDSCMYALLFSVSNQWYDMNALLFSVINQTYVWHECSLVLSYQNHVCMHSCSQLSNPCKTRMLSFSQLLNPRMLSCTQLSNPCMYSCLQLSNPLVISYQNPCIPSLRLSCIPSLRLSHPSIPSCSRCSQHNNSDRDIEVWCISCSHKMQTRTAK